MRLLVAALVLAGALTGCGQATAPSQSMPAASDASVAQGAMSAERRVDAPAPPNASEAGEEISADRQQHGDTVSPNAAQTAYGLTGIPDLQAAYGAAERGEYLPAALREIRFFG